MTLLNGTMTPIQTVTVGAGGAASIDFQNIPQTYTDLVIKLSGRGSFTGIRVQFNNDTGTNYSWRSLRGTGSVADSESNVTYGSPYNTFVYFRSTSTTADTANTFGNSEIYIPNYTSSNAKSTSSDGVTENNATLAFTALTAGLWTGTAAITRVTLTMDAGGSLSQHSTATLYGVTSVGTAAKATGGIITSDANYYYHTFTTSGTFTPTQNLTADYLVVAGGGGAGGGDATNNGGGGGAGGLRSTVGATGGGGSLESAISLTNATAYTITVGAGGTGSANGSDSSIAGSGLSTITAVGGGKGGGPLDGVNPSVGGSGGGGRSFGNQSGANGTNNQGYGGGSGKEGETQYPGGGGGGAGGVGETPANSSSNGGSGGIGVQNNISGTNSYYAGGGGAGAKSVAGIGGLGGGGNGSTNLNSATPGTNNTGGGAGSNGGTGNKSAVNGGSGIVIIRYPK